MTGTAVAAKIRDAYNFIVQNYVPGDQIYLFGFSRGAFTARKVAGLLNTLGLLDKEQMSLFFPYWCNLHKRNRVNEVDLQKLGKDVEIEFLGVWDTVGSILENGIKALKNLLGIKDTSLPACVKQARHALAYHEERSYFRCTPFTVNEGDKRLVQVWFPGVHADVGGGYKEHQISDISLLWMAGELKNAGVDLDEDYLDTRLSPATKDGLEVHYESKPNVGNGSRRNIFQETMQHPSTYCHRSLWATLKHLDSGRGDYWSQPAQNLNLLPARAGELNGIERRFWVQRWMNTIPIPVPTPTGRGPMRRPAPDVDLDQVHDAPEEDEGPAALFE
ncbi:hypothetical protein FRC08_014616 [Ceratobasidium sp. 394]|nr:hypothetical protein FRC08_014616 [Ceratobasidium sp. 394]